MGIGQLRKRVTFQEEVRTPDGGGGFMVSWRNAVTVYGGIEVERGRERIAAGRLEAAETGILTVRSSTDTREVAAMDRALIDGVQYNIRAINNPDQRNKFLEMIIEKGVAT